MLAKREEEEEEEELLVIGYLQQRTLRTLKVLPYIPTYKNSDCSSLSQSFPTFLVPKYLVMTILQKRIILRLAFKNFIYHDAKKSQNMKSENSENCFLHRRQRGVLENLK